MRTRHVLLLTVNIAIITALTVATINAKSRTKLLENKVSDLQYQLDSKTQKNDELNKTLQTTNDSLLKASNVIKIYDSLVADLYDNINAPICSYDSEYADVFSKSDSFIKNSMNPQKELVFKIGPIKKDINDTYFIDYIIYSKLSLDENPSQITGAMPPPLLSHHMLKYHCGKIEIIQ